MNKHNITLIRMCEILDDDIHWKVFRIRMPIFIYKYAYDRFIKEFNTLFGESDNTESFDKSIILLDIFNEAYNLIPIIVDNLKRGETPEGMFEFIRDNYGIQDQDIHIIIGFLLNEQKRLAGKYEELSKQPEDPVEPKKNLFADIIASVEDNLNITINRSMSMYMFHSQYKRSLAKIEAYNKLKDKPNG